MVEGVLESIWWKERGWRRLVGEEVHKGTVSCGKDGGLTSHTPGNCSGTPYALPTGPSRLCFLVV